MKTHQKYPVKEGCPKTCYLKCSEIITEEERLQINQKYWDLDFERQKGYIFERVTKLKPKRMKDKSSKNNTFSFTIRKPIGDIVKVCKVFFLTTLGFKYNNDSVLRVFKRLQISDQAVHSIDNLKDGRCRSHKECKYDHEAVKAHVETYGPALPHYRREHAPNRRYLPSDVSVKDMYLQHKALNETNKDMSYNLFWQIFKTMNISFTQLGNEECEVCTKFYLHKLNCQCELQCSKYTGFINHKRKYLTARKNYDNDADKAITDREIYVAVDLQKVIMLPRMEQFKDAIFTRRLCVFNETFAGLGARKNFATIWHEAIAGRQDEDIASAYYVFLNAHRDAEVITIWADNCTAQNKNWTLYTMLIYLVNSDKLAAKKIVIKYFEPGHTFMAADSVHAEVENQMKKIRKVYNFTDFKSCVEAAGCKTKEMIYSDFKS